MTSKKMNPTEHSIAVWAYMERVKKRLGKNWGADDWLPYEEVLKVIDEEFGNFLHYGELEE